MAAVSISWLEASAYAELERANGIRLPPSDGDASSGGLHDAIVTHE